MILDMKRITLIGMNSEKAELLKELNILGAVQVDDMSASLQNEGWAGLKCASAAQDEVQELDQKIALLNNAIDCLTPFDTKKKGLFAQKPIVSSLDVDAAIRVAKIIDENERQLVKLRSQINALRNNVEALEPWANMDIPTTSPQMRECSVIIGTLNASDGLDSLALPDSAHMEIISTNVLMAYVLVICHNDVTEAVMEELSKLGFARFSPPSDSSGTPREAIVAANAHISALEMGYTQTHEATAAMLVQLPALKAGYDILTVRRERIAITDKLLETESAFLLSGWIPEYLVETVLGKLYSKFTCYADITPPGEDEEFPVLLKNAPLIQPFEAVTEQYSLPAPRGMDPNTIMGPTYFLFFGMMLSDAGYGILLTAICSFILFKFKPQGGMKRFLGLFALCGISTIFWGALFGGWFGNIAGSILPPLWFDPLQKPMQLLILSFVLGILHLFLGMGCKAYILIKRGKWLDALFDVGLWYLTLTGGVLCLVAPIMDIMGMEVSASLSETLAGLAQAGTYMAIAGAAGLVLTQGRSSKNIFAKIINGIGSLYDITAYLSDVLSYSRLLALGLSTGVVAMVVNTMGAMTGPFGMPFVFIIGHGINIAINILGAYVHACRLQYVEFFGKFYESGGVAFTPFDIKTQYVLLKEDN